MVLLVDFCVSVCQACATFAASFVSLITGYCVDKYTTFSAAMDLRHVRHTINRHPSFRRVERGQKESHRLGWCVVWWCRGRVFPVDSIVAKAKGAVAGGAKVLVCHEDDAEEVRKAIAAGEEGLGGGSLLKVVGIRDLVELMRYTVGSDPSLPSNVQCTYPYLVCQADSSSCRLAASHASNHGCGCVQCGVGEDRKVCQALLDEPDEGYFLGCACSLTYIAERTQVEPHSPAPSTAEDDSSSSSTSRRVKPAVVTGVRPQGTAQVSQAGEEAGSRK